MTSSAKRVPDAEDLRRDARRLLNFVLGDVALIAVLLPVGLRVGPPVGIFPLLVACALAYLGGESMTLRRRLLSDVASIESGEWWGR